MQLQIIKHMQDALNFKQILHVQQQKMVAHHKVHVSPIKYKEDV